MPEPYTGSSIILRIIASGKAEEVVTGLKFGAIVLGVIIGVVIVGFVIYRLVYAPD